MTVLTNAAPAREKEFVLKIADNRAHALADEKELSRARGWLARVLLDADALETHTDWLCEKWHTTFRPPLPRGLREGLAPARPPSASPFPDNALGEPELARIVNEGVENLSPETTVRLLLDPYALWDLGDRIESELPDHWLPLMDRVGDGIGRELGIEVSIPGLESPRASSDTHVEAADTRITSADPLAAPDQAETHVEELLLKIAKLSKTQQLILLRRLEGRKPEEIAKEAECSSADVIREWQEIWEKAKTK
jgi:hypothetical protein